MNWRPEFDVEIIDKELIVPVDSLCDYHSMNSSRRDIVSEKLRYLYNKNNIKKEFEEIGFNVCKLYKYSTEKFDISSFTKDIEKFVAKPSHMSFSDNVIVKKNQKFNSSNLETLNSSLLFETTRDEPQMLKKCERGIIIEQYVDIVYELKVFVVWGCPLLADLRTGDNEFYRVDFVLKENDYINWDFEYELIKEFANKFKIDFFRIDFLFDGNKLYASECAFMPSSLLPDEIEDILYRYWSSAYFDYYLL